jgi:peroxiredoxin
LNFGPLLAAALLAAAPTPNAHDIATGELLALNGTKAPASAPATHDAPAALAVGDPAPDFSYQSRDYLWQSLHNMLEHGSVLLVFGATDEQLRSLERDQAELVGGGVIPVAVVAQREGEVWRTVRRDGLTYSLLADPHAVITEQFGAFDPATKQPRPRWFVIDPTGRVRGAGEAPSATRDWIAIAGSALGRSDVRTASTR